MRAFSENDPWLTAVDGPDPEAVGILQRADAACRAAKVVQYNATYHTKWSDSRVSGMMRKDVPNRRLRITAKRVALDPSREGEYEYSWADTTCRFVSHLDRRYLHGAYSGFNHLPRDVWRLNMFELGLDEPFGEELKCPSRYEGQERVEGILCDVVYLKYQIAGHYARWYIGPNGLPRRVERYDNMFPDLPAKQRVVKILTITDVEVNPPLTDEDFLVPQPQGYTETVLTPQPLAVRTTAPDWALETTDGETVTLV